MPLSQSGQIPLPPSPIVLARKLPTLVARSTSLLPFNIRKKVMISVLQHLFREALEDGDFEFLQDRYLKVEIKDARLTWFFSFDHGDIVIQQSAKEDVSISGNLKEFLLLASRKEDPDTLFFQRRLLIEGDTEIGLEIKNVMDGIDLDTLPSHLRTAMDKITDLVCRLQAN